MRPTLRYGSRGADVQHLQELLNKFLCPTVVLTIDGEFGPRTEAAVRIYQASMGISIDGLVGMQTWSALDDVVPHHDIAVSMPATSDAPWLDVAMKEIGQRERRGPQHNPRILEYHATTSLHATNDETAWCSSFVNWCLGEVNITGTNSASAVSWINWGKASHPKTGAITVIQQTTGRSAGSGNHVAFFLQDNGSHIKLLGGNQSNRVKESLYPRSAWRVVCCRWPGK
jgi:uncharacterized protein (TIGR02594 family)